MTDQELKDLVASLAVAQAETERRFQETDRRLAEQSQETARRLGEQSQETNRQLRQLGQQIGGLGEKFGGFTEGMAFPAMRKILAERFGMSVIAPRVTVRRGDKTLELDVLAYSNTHRNEVYVVEVKSHLRDDGLDQMLKILRDFPEFLPEHRNKRLYGILAAVDVPDDLAARVLAHGIFLARLHGDVFELQVPEGFTPRSFQTPAP